MEDAPLILGKHGEFRMPQDIWETAFELVKTLRELGESYEFAEADLEGMACTIIAAALYAERAGMMQSKN